MTVLPLREVPGSSFLALLKDAEAQKVEAGAAIHLALDELKPMDLPFDVALIPRQPESFAHGVEVSFESGCEPGQC